MDMTEVKNLEQPTEDLSQIKPSEWLRRGIPMVSNARGHYYEGGRSACALGTAYYAKMSALNPEHLKSADSLFLETACAALGLPFNIGTQISTAHATRQWSREQCADALETMGY